MYIRKRVGVVREWELIMYINAQISSLWSLENMDSWMIRSQSLVAIIIEFWSPSQDKTMVPRLFRHQF